MFHRPIHNHLPTSYFCGHSLGLQPIATKEYMALELDKWAKQAVDGHFDEPNPWFHYPHFLKPGLAHLCGAKESEVVAYGSLTSNLHFLLASFYQPTTQKHKILAEDIGFPSDTFALETHAKFRGFNPKETIVWLKHDASFCFSTDYILSQIEEYNEELALIWLSGVNFMSGQVADMKEIARAASQHGIRIGFDLAHAIGNVPLHLHDWGIDFAVWCSYKYLNAGPGAVGGYFIHEKNFPNKLDTTTCEPNILAGWWGNKEETRFQTQQSFDPIPNADAWQHSNANVLSLAALRASLDIFLANQIADLHAKSSTQTKIAFEWLQNVPGVQLLTPLENKGNMLSVMLPKQNKKLIAQLKSRQITADWREPNILRFSFCPLYNTNDEWQQFMDVLHELL